MQISKEILIFEELLNYNLKDNKMKQKSKIGVAGNLTNQIMGNNSTLPEVGKGATELLYSDRRCYEVIEVSVDYKTVKLEILHTMADVTKECQIGHQNWIHTPSGYYVTIVWRKGKWRKKLREVVFVKPNMCSSDLTEEELKLVYGNHIFPINVVDGLTKEVVNYQPMSIIFGVKDYHRDWSF